MTGRMAVIAVRATGQVLGAATSVAAAGSPVLSGLVGDQMPLRIDDDGFAVPADALVVTDLGFDARVFEAPYAAHVLFPSASDQSASLSFTSTGLVGAVDAGTVEKLLTITAHTGSAAGAIAAVVADTAFWVLLRGPVDEPPRMVSGLIKAGANKSDAVAHGLTSGTAYTAVILLAGGDLVRQENVTPK